MEGNGRKLSLRITGDMEKEIETLKQGRYREKSYAEIYRILIWRGLERTALMHGGQNAADRRC